MKEKKRSLKRGIALFLAAALVIGGVQISTKRAEAEVDVSQYMAGVSKSGYIKVPHDQLTVKADSEEMTGEKDKNGSGEDECAVDGKVDTYWHSMWQTGGGEAVGGTEEDVKGNNTITVKLTTATTLAGITYLPRQVKEASNNGLIERCNIYISKAKDGSFGDEPFMENVTVGTYDVNNWETSITEKEILFEEPQTDVTAVKLEALEIKTTAPVAINAAEIGLLTTEKTNAEIEEVDSTVLLANAKASSQKDPVSDSDGLATWAFDDEDHWWHSNYDNGDTSGEPSDQNPVWIQTGFGENEKNEKNEKKLVTAITYQGRSTYNGRIYQFKVQTANVASGEPQDGDFTDAPATRTTLRNIADEQIITLAQPTEATHIRLVVTSVYTGNVVGEADGQTMGDNYVAAKRIRVFAQKNAPIVEQSEVVEINNNVLASNAKANSYNDTDNVGDGRPREAFTDDTQKWWHSNIGGVTENNVDGSIGENHSPAIWIQTGFNTKSEDGSFVPGESRKINGLVYQGKETSTRVIENFKIYVSDAEEEPDVMKGVDEEDTTWTQVENPSMTFFENTAAAQTVTFDTVSARWIRLVATSAYEGWGSYHVAALNIKILAEPRENEGLTSIAITQQPDTDLIIGQEISKEGMIVTGYYNNAEGTGSGDRLHKNLAEDAEIIGYDPLKTGQQTVTVKVGDATAEMTVNVKLMSNIGNEIPADTLKAHANANSYQSLNDEGTAGKDNGNDGDATFAFNGNPENHWHSKYSTGVGVGGVPTEENMIWIRTGFGETKTISALEYTPRSNGMETQGERNIPNGIIRNYKIQVTKQVDESGKAKADDTVDELQEIEGLDNITTGWVTVKEGVFELTRDPQMVEFPAVEATHIRLVALSASDWNPDVADSEFKGGNATASSIRVFEAAEVDPATVLVGITAAPAKDTFVQGEDITEGAVVSKVYGDGHTVVIEGNTGVEFATEYKKDSSPAGTYNVTVKYREGEQDYAAAYTVTVQEKEAPPAAVLQSLTIASTKESYNIGEELELTITAGYDDNSTKTLTKEDVEVNGYDNSKPGTCSVTATYTENGKSVTSAPITVTVVDPNAAQGPVVTDGLIAYYTFEDADIANGFANQIADTGVGNATIGGQSSLITKSAEGVKSNGSVSFANEVVGENRGYLQVDNAFSSKADSTISFWMKADPTLTENRPAYDSSLFHDYIVSGGSTDGRPIIRYLGGSHALGSYLDGSAHKQFLQEGNTEGNILQDNWYHVAVVHNAAEGKLICYVDGDAYAELTMDPTAYRGADSSLHSLIIGAHRLTGGGCCHYKGLMDNVRIYNKAIAAADVAQIYSSEKPNWSTTAKFAEGSSVEQGTIAATVEGKTVTSVAHPSAVVFKAEAKEGYSFEGWYSDEAGTALVSETADYTQGSVRKPITLYAKFAEILPDPEAITVTPVTAELKSLDQEVTLTATPVPDGSAAPASYTWTTDKEDLIVLNANGATATVKAKGYGKGEATVTVKATTAGGKELAAVTAVISVDIAAPADPTEVTVTPATGELKSMTASVELTAATGPAGSAAPESYAWTTDSELITVTGNGNKATVKAAKAGKGEATVTVTATTAGGKELTATAKIMVDVKDEPVTPPEPTELTVTPAAVTLDKLDATQILTATAGPEGSAAPESYTWTTDSELITVTGSGNTATVKAAKAGKGTATVTVTATTASGRTITSTVTVNVNIEEQIAPTPEPKLESLEVVVDGTGLKVFAVYSDGTKKDVTSEVMISGYDPKKTGKQQITVTFGGKTYTADVEAPKGTDEPGTPDQPDKPGTPDKPGDTQQGQNGGNGTAVSTGDHSPVGMMAMILLLAAAMMAAGVVLKKKEESNR